MENDFIKNIQVGDTVIIDSTRYGADSFRERKVSRLTRTQIIIEWKNDIGREITARYRREYGNWKAGREIGGDEYHPSKLISPLDKRYLLYLKKTRIKELKGRIQVAINLPETEDEIDNSISCLIDLAAYIGINEKETE